MGFNVKNFSSPPVEAKFEKNGEVLSLRLNADVITPRLMEETQKLAAESSSGQIDGLDEQVKTSRYMAKILVKLIAGWDAVAESGSTVAITEDYFMELPFALLSDLFRFCFEAIAPKPTTAATSDDSTLSAVN